MTTEFVQCVDIYVRAESIGVVISPEQPKKTRRRK